MLPLFLASLLGMAQTPKASEVLTINGYAGDIPVIQVNGKSYVEVVALARLANGSVSFQPNRITLSLAAAAPQTEQAAKKGYSVDFLRAAIEEMAAIREWRVAIVEAVQHSYPLKDDWLGAYPRAADSKLALVSAAASTDADRSGVALVNSEFGKAQSFSDEYLAMSKSMTYIAPDSVNNDLLGQQILRCAQSLESLPAGGPFQDILVCH